MSAAAKPPFVPQCDPRYARFYFKQLVDQPALCKRLYIGLLPPEILALTLRYVPLDDGVYFLMFDGRGTPATLSSGQQAHLGSFISANVGQVTSMRSLSNDNSILHVMISRLGPLPTMARDEQTALVVEGSVFHLGRPDKLDAAFMADTWFAVHSHAESALLQRRYNNVTPQLRTHPRHRVAVEWAAAAAHYPVNARQVGVTMRARNVGDKDVNFTVGGSNRGPRENQFDFTATYVDGKVSVPDTGSSMNFGGFMSSVRLAPGGEHVRQVDLCKWFKFERAGTYAVTGSYRFVVVAPQQYESIWDDTLTGTFTVVMK